MAVKCTTEEGDSLKSETNYLTRSSLDPTRPSCIPLLVFRGTNYWDFGITPVGLPLVPDAFRNSQQIHQILDDIVDALTWLSAQSIVHRDVRCENIIVTEASRAVLIDFGSAYDVSRRNMTMYRGGFICCPPRHPRKVHAAKEGWGAFYVPSVADDAQALVLLVSHLLFPSGFLNFRSCDVGNEGSEEAIRILQLWDQIEASVVWKPFLTAAMMVDWAALRDMKSFFQIV